jgi:hypothetical protein
MAEIIAQGELNIAGTIIAVGSKASIPTKIFMMRFYNPLAYVLTVERYDAITMSSVTLYEFNLSAGDTVNDNFTYALNSGDKLTVYSDIPGTSYYIYGIDYADN